MSKQRIEICERSPIKLGGDPNDDENKMKLDQEAHVGYVRYWNGIIRELRSKP